MLLTKSNIAPEPAINSIILPGALTCDAVNNLCTVDVDLLTHLEYEFYIYMSANGGAYKYSTK